MTYQVWHHSIGAMTERKNKKSDGSIRDNPAIGGTKLHERTWKQCVAQQTRHISYLENRSGILEKNSSEMRLGVQELNSQFAALKAENNALQKANKLLGRSNSNLKAENHALQQAMMDLRTKYEELKKFQANLAVVKPDDSCAFCQERDNEIRKLKRKHSQVASRLALLTAERELQTSRDKAIKQKKQELLYELSQRPSFSAPIQEDSFSKQSIEECEEERDALKTKNLSLQAEIDKLNADKTDWQPVGNSDNTGIQPQLPQSENATQPLSTTDTGVIKPDSYADLNLEVLELFKDDTGVMVD